MISTFVRRLKTQVSQNGLGLPELRLILFFSTAYLYYKAFTKRIFLALSSNNSNKKYLPRVPTILFVTSKLHFSPIDKSEERYSDSGIHLVLRRVYHSLNILFPEAVVHVVDKEDIIPSGFTYNLLIGLCESNMFKTVAKSAQFNCSYVVPILVNSSSLFRISQYINFLKSSNQVSTVSPCEINNTPFRQIDVLSLANFALLVGNQFTLRTFTSTRKLLSLKICTFNIWPPQIFKYDPSVGKCNQTFVFSASNIGIRKGSFITLKAWSLFNRDFPETRLYIIGGIDTHYQDIFLSLIDESVTIAGWVTNEQQQKILNLSQYVISPSLEEGQVSAVLEAMKLGCIPIASPHCGIDLDQLTEYQVDDPLDVSALYNILVYTQESTKEDINFASSLVLEQMEAKHTGTDSSEDILVDILRSNLQDNEAS